MSGQQGKGHDYSGQMCVNLFTAPASGVSRSETHRKLINHSRFVRVAVLESYKCISREQVKASLVRVPRLVRGWSSKPG